MSAIDQWLSLRFAAKRTRTLTTRRMLATGPQKKVTIHLNEDTSATQRDFYTVVLKAAAGSVK